MRISPVCFNSKTQKVNNRQDFDELSDKATEEHIREMLPLFINGEADVVLITKTVTPDGDLQTSAKPIKKEELSENLQLAEKKETFWDKIKKIFKK